MKENKKIQNKKKQKVAFIHPDLGIGGAEQLIINLALALKENEVDVTIITPYHDKNHCFQETINGSLNVKVAGNIFPSQIFGKCQAICAMIRMILATLYALIFIRQYDIYVVDQITSCLPFIWLFRKKILFYCHFPDKLLCTERKSIIKKIYRFFIDLLEELCLLPANIIVVNSQFTKQIYSKYFPILKKLKKQPEVLYPTIDFSKFQLTQQDNIQNQQQDKFFFSLNRFENKKNVKLALKAFKELKQKQKQQNKLDNTYLIIAGGYDEKVQENIDNFKELNELSKNLDIQQYIRFEKNITNEQRAYYLKNCQAVLYTPSNEHFGIVPIEAMYNQTPVIAMNNGGPKETINDNNTGFLLEEDPQKWQEAMSKLLENQELRVKMGKYGKNRVEKLFGFNSFKENIYSYYELLINKNKKKN